jgi:hypothetical protein
VQYTCMVVYLRVLQLPNHGAWVGEHMHGRQSQTQQRRRRLLACSSTRHSSLQGLSAKKLRMKTSAGTRVDAWVGVGGLSPVPCSGSKQQQQCVPFQQEKKKVLCSRWKGHLPVCACGVQCLPPP